MSPPTDFQKLLLSRLDHIEGKLDKQDEKIDTIKVMVTSQGAQLQIHEHRLHGAETRLGHLDSDFDELTENTGKHEFASIQAKATKLEESKTHWLRWLLTTVAAVMIATLTALVTRAMGR